MNAKRWLVRNSALYADWQRHRALRDWRPVSQAVDAAGRSDADREVGDHPAHEIGAELHRIGTVNVAGELHALMCDGSEVRL